MKQGDIPFSGVLLLLIIVVIVLNVYRHGSLLDALNAVISSQVEFSVFYAGVPGLPPSIKIYPELASLEQRFAAIRAEVLPLVERSERVPTMQSTYNNMFLGAVDKHTQRNRWYHPLSGYLWRILYGKHLDIFNKIATDRWRTMNLILYDQVVWENAILCPTLMNALLDMRCVQTALLSFMQPGASVPPHSDPATGVLRYHLAIVVPRERHKCYIRINNHKYVWEEGKSVIFDTVYEHEVHNDTDECRVVLFLDLYRPLNGIAGMLQSFANEANRISPGTRAVMSRSNLNHHS